MRILRPALAALLTSAFALVVVPALAAASPTPVSETASSGVVSASFTYSIDTDQFSTTGMHLAITRSGATAYDAAVKVKDCSEPYCQTIHGLAGDDVSSLTVSDLDGDGEPEVLVDVFTGGAHCCSITQVFLWNGTTYVPTTHNWGDGGYRLKDRNHDGIPDFTTDDDAFAYLYVSYAESLRPMLVLDFHHGTWVDVTTSYRRALKLEAARSFRLARRACRSGNATLGAYAAWTADKYRLKQRKGALRQLKAEQRRGCLKAEGPGFPRAKKYIAKLDKFLRRHGYVR